MRRKSFDGFECGIAQALELIGDPWSILILRDALFGISTFDGFHQNLGISKNTLSVRLNTLVENGIFSRESDPDDGRRTKYRLEEAGRELWVVLLAISQWGNKWAFDKMGPPSFMADRKEQRPVAAIEVKDFAGHKLTLDDVTMIPGPSASPRLQRVLTELMRTRP